MEKKELENYLLKLRKYRKEMEAWQLGLQQNRLENMLIQNG
jgi:hypothetical protein